MSDLLHPFAAADLPTSADPVAASAAAYATEVAELLYTLLVDVIRVRAPDIEPVVRGDASGLGLPIDRCVRALQAQGIWFQLLSIAEQNAAMRRRRQVEVARGLEGVKGTFASVFAEAVAADTPASAIEALLERLRIRPVITAHPTEAKRVTVLEKHRRIYRRLVDLESPRWTPRERRALEDQLRDEIDLLWMTGELRLEKPTVPAGGVLGPALLPGDAVRRGAGNAGAAGAGARAVLSWRHLQRVAVLPVRIVGGRRPGRQPVRHQRSHPQYPQREPGRVTAPIPAATDGAGAAPEHLGSCGAGVTRVPRGARACPGAER